MESNTSARSVTKRSSTEHPAIRYSSSLSIPDWETIDLELRLTPDNKSSIPSTDSAESPDEATAGSLQEPTADIQYQTCSWPRTTMLLLAMYIGMAMLGLPAVFSTLGYVPAICFAVLIAASCQYTGLVVWRFCLRHPEVRDICDIGRIILGNSFIGWLFTAIMLVFNNTVSFPLPPMNLY